MKGLRFLIKTIILIIYLQCTLNIYLIKLCIHVQGIYYIIITITKLSNPIGYQLP